MLRTKLLFVILMSLLLSSVLLAQQSQSPTTFCNPLNLNYRFMVDAVDAREAADPVVVLFQDDYYLFASRSGGYWTSPDLRNWTLIVPTGLDLETYAPAIVVIGDTLFYIPSANGQIYRTSDPKSGIWTTGPTVNSYGDPDLFLDDDGRLYMYYGLSNQDYIRVVELNPTSFQEIGSPVVLFNGQAAQHGWERRGDDNLLDEQPWIEGSWMIKANGKYYLHYAAPGTEFKTYADGIYEADSAKGPFTYATYSPIDFKPTGFICGAGHGCTFKDKDDQYWHIGTMTISVKAMFERRLGLFPVGFSEDGDIYCNTVWGDYPQYLPGENETPAEDNFSGMMLLSRKKYVLASSSLSDHGVQYAVDEDARTYWCAQTGDSSEWLMVDLGRECGLQALQVNFAEHNTNPDLVRGRSNVIYEQYIIYTSTDGMIWDVLIDKSQNMQDVPHDYIELEQEVVTRYVKIKNVFTPGNGLFAIRDLRLFGNSGQAEFTTVDDFTIERNETDGRDAIIRWSTVENADGYLIRYGITPDKLYNHYLAYDTDSVAIHSLNNGVEYYFSVEAFDNGTDYYQPVGEIRSFQSGDWSDVNTWQQYDGEDWIHPAPGIPGSADGAISILDGHTVTVTAVDSADQLTVAAGAVLAINLGITFKVNDGIETDLMVEGTLKNFGSVSKQSSATIAFANNGTYMHEQDGGSLPVSIWRPNSICQLDSIISTAPSNRNQNFYSVLWNCPRQNANLNMGWNGTTIAGNIIVQNTGTARWYMCAPGTGTAATVNINGDIIQSGGQFSSNGTGNDGTTITINHHGNINVTGGNFAISRGSQGGDAGTGITIWNILDGNISLANATTQNSCPRAKFVFSKNGGTQTLNFSNVTFAGGGFPVEVDSSTTLDMGSSMLRGSGIFNLKAGATLQTAHVAGLDSTLANTGSRTLSQAANYVFNGTVAQATGTILPDTLNSLMVIDNTAGVSFSTLININGTLELKKGSLSLAGSVLTYGPDGSLKYSGTSSRTTSDVEFPSVNGPKNLITGSIGGVTLHATRSVANLILSGKLKLENNNLTVDSIYNAASTRFVSTNGVGKLKLPAIGTEQKLFPVGTTVYAPVWISNDGVIDTIGVSVLTDGTSATYPRVRTKWNISESTIGSGNYTLQIGWMSSLENTAFRTDRENNALIFNLTDTTEAGSGNYTTQFITQPYSVSRSNVTTLGPMGVGRFDLATGIVEEEGNLPLKFSLSQNYPNPFNPVTRIKYEIPKFSMVSLKIYDVLGREVITLFNGNQKAGKYDVEWRATNFASGIYFYHLQAGDFSDTKKLILLR